ncbi:hypothetical protein JD844_027284 [Phrynosoma platyrhinos]|uniref:Beta-glucosidase n=1 Tax=Phrynosoma platyrhinos TaxID=52577 RepID=A0ABQ7SG29_PHRPL|nr:hypothetical protein JD844_027284 [Phrynosoma platyrhinos]
MALGSAAAINTILTSPVTCNWDPESASFPGQFAWGAATAAYQIEGISFCFYLSSVREEGAAEQKNLLQNA